MPIEIIEGSIEHVPQIYDCSWRAFGNDLLQKAMFPIADDDIEGLQKLKEFRLLKLTKRLSKPGCHTFVAIDKEIDNGSRVLGYAVWYEEAVFEITNGERKPPDKVEDQPEIPKSINVKLLKRIEKIIDGTRKEFLKELDGKMWYLTTLGVDPDFGGRGIASKLVKQGVEQAQRANLPAYTESTPAAVRVYAKQGFKELGRIEVLEDGSYYFTAMLKMPDVSSTLQASA